MPDPVSGTGQARSGIQEVKKKSNIWIPAFAGMTVKMDSPVRPGNDDHL
jgi:hypothetical protein